MRRRIIAALSLSMVACSAIASFDGLVGSDESSDGGSDGSTADGRVQSTSDGSVGPTEDGSSFDAGSSSDAMSLSDTYVGYCAGHPGHTFCDDFDLNNTLMGRWATTVHIGSVGISTGDFTSQPHEMLATSPDNDGGVDGENDIEREFDTSQSLDVEAAIRITLLAQSSDILAIQFTPSNVSIYSDCYFDVSYDMGVGTILEAECDQPDGGRYYQNATIISAQPNWNRVHLGINMTNALIVGTMDGKKAMLNFPSGMTTNKFSVMAGVVYKTSGPGNSVVRVDDLFVDTQ